MFIRRTVSKSKKYNDEKYYTYRLVESYRVDNKVKQRVLLNLGPSFNVDKDKWSILATRIEDIIKKRNSFFNIDKDLETLAQQYALQIISTTACSVEDTKEDYQTIDTNTIELVDPKSIGVEHVVYETIKKLELEKLLETLDLTPTQRYSAIGTLIAKTTNPLSDNKTLDWLCNRSGAGELYGCDYKSISSNSIYRVADILLNNKDKIEQHLYNKTKQIFQYDETITLYDLTNTYFEGDINNAPLAKRGRSKEKRSDAKIITLAVVLDSSGFIKNSKIFAGNISEPSTLQQMIDTLKVQTTKDSDNKTLLKSNTNALVVMDAGIATTKNIEYLKTNGYEYLVVSRKRDKQFDKANSCVVKTNKDNEPIVRAQKVLIYNEDGDIKECELYCHSSARQSKEDSMQTRVQTQFIESLKYLKAGLTLPKRMKRYDKVLEKIGALKTKYSTIAKYYDITVQKDTNSNNAIDISYKEKMGTDNKSVFNGVYCLRTNNTTMDEKTLWKTYTTLTDLEAVFRTLKTELALRPIYHQKQSRIDAHLFITTIAYTIIHTIRYQLKASNINYSWTTIKELLSPQIRVTTTAKCKDGKILYLRKSSQLNEKQKEIFKVLNITYKAGPITKIYK